mgnify:CR=1 FL=1
MAKDLNENIRPFCRECGTMLKPGDKFCPECGTRINFNEDVIDNSDEKKGIFDAIFRSGEDR